MTIKDLKDVVTDKEVLKTAAGAAYMLVFIGSIVGLARLSAKQEQGATHLNVVLEKENKKLLVEDVNTKDQRILEYDNCDCSLYAFPYIQPGDTVNVMMKEEKYKSKKYLPVRDCSLVFNNDSINARKERELFYAKRREMQQQR